MSVIAVKVNKDNIEICSDSQTSFGGDKKIKEDPCKLFKVGDIVFGTVGYVYEGQMMRLYLEEKKPNKLHSELDYVKFFKGFYKWIAEETDSNKDPYNTYVFVAYGKCFVFDLFYCEEVKDFTAVGSGGSKALMGLELGHSVKDSVAATCKYDLYCHEPLIYHKISK